MMQAKVSQFEKAKELAISLSGSRRPLQRRDCPFNDCYDQCTSACSPFLTSEIGCDASDLGCFTGCCISCGC